MSIKKAFWDWPKEHQNPSDAADWAEANQDKVEFLHTYNGYVLNNGRG